MGGRSIRPRTPFRRDASPAWCDIESLPGQSGSPSGVATRREPHTAWCVADRIVCAEAHAYIPNATGGRRRILVTGHADGRERLERWDLDTAVPFICVPG